MTKNSSIVFLSYCDMTRASLMLGEPDDDVVDELSPHMFPQNRQLD